MLIIIFTISWIKSSYIFFFSFKWLAVIFEHKKQKKCGMQAHWYPGHSLGLVWQRHWAERIVVAGVTRTVSYPKARGNAQLSRPKETLIRTRNKVYIPISILAASHHLNPSAAISLFQRLDSFFLLSLLKFWWLHGPCTVYLNKSILVPDHSVADLDLAVRSLKPVVGLAPWPLATWSWTGAGHAIALDTKQGAGKQLLWNRILLLRSACNTDGPEWRLSLLVYSH